MILRCVAPRKHDPVRLCGQWLAAVPDGYAVLRIVRQPSEAAPETIVLSCRRCHALHEVAIPLRDAA